MLKFCKTIIVFTLIAIIFGCAQPKSVIMKASPLADQTLRYEQGHQVFISRGVQYSVALALPTEIVKPGNPIDFFVYIQNNSNNPLNFSTENIHAQCGQKNIYIYHPQEALQDEEKRTDISHSDLAGLTPADISLLSPQMASYYQRRNQELQNFSQSLLKAQTISENTTHEGRVRMAFPSCSGKLKLTIQTGNDIHTFEFETTFK